MFFALNLNYTVNEFINTFLLNFIVLNLYDQIMQFIIYV